MNFDYLKRYFGPFRFYVISVAVLLASVYLGYQLGHYLEVQEREELDMLRQTVDNLSEENANLTRRINVMGVELEVQELANQEAQQVILEGIAREAQLRERLGFFEKIMAPELKEQGFVIDAFNVTAAASQGYFRFDLVLMQQAKIKSVVKGTVSVELEGSLDGKPVRVPLQEMMEEGEGPLAFSFKYFQVIEGVFQMPPGFVPEYIHTSAEIFQFKRKRGDLNTRFDWPVQVPLSARQPGQNDPP